ncbi:MAG: hypothetical protein ABI534_05990 [Chloroflexota bacterium]
MSLHIEAPPRAASWPVLRRLRLLAVGFLALLLASQLIGVPARAERPPPTSMLSGDEAVDSGQSIVLAERTEGASTLLVASLPEAAIAARGEVLDAARLLDVAPDVGTLLTTDLVADQSGTLTIQHDDGSQLLVTVPGVTDGELSPDASWVAVIDGIGRLLRVDAASAEMTEIAAGPFLGPITFEADGMLLLLGVSSVEAPWQSRLIRLDPANGVMVALSGEELVYGAMQMGDRIAYAAHDSVTGSTVVRRVAPTGSQLIADLGPLATDVDIARDGSAIAYEVVGDGIYLTVPGSGRATRISAGSDPRFSPDGALLAVRHGVGTVVLARDGSVLDRIDETTVAWSECSEECGS